MVSDVVGGELARVIVLPGFTRRADDVRLFTNECEGHGWDVRPVTVAPRSLAPLYMNPRRLNRLATRLAVDGLPLAVVGHSAGAAAGCYLTRALLQSGCDVRGLVMADGVDSPNHLIARVLPDLTRLRVSAVLAPPSPCNRNGALGLFLAAYPWVRVSLVEGAGHGDFEGHGLAIYRRVCGDDSTEQIGREFRERVRAEIAWVLGEGEAG